VTEPTKRDLQDRMDDLEKEDDQQRDVPIAYKDTETDRLYDGDGEPLSSDVNPLMILEEEVEP